MHGTTATTNAVLERRLARVGMITTRGFRDVIELGRRTRPTPYGLFGRFEPIVPRDLRLEVPERIEATGCVRVPLDEGAVEAAARTLLAMGCEALVIHFVHACANPEHELRAEAVVREVWPNDHVTLGHALVSEAREFERGVTAAVNAAVQPVLERYVERLREGLARGGYRRDYLVMNGNGGTVSSRLVAREAARTVMSGPAAGVIAAARLGARAGFERLITYDMGGTSTDVAFVEDGRPLISDETEIEYAMPIHVPMVDVRTIGAGGGSIARVDEAGLLQVGPRSAGSTPGPICFGRGGAAPTVTDANVVLGRLSLDDLMGVERPPPLSAVEAAFEREIGRPLGLDAVGGGGGGPARGRAADGRRDPPRLHRPRPRSAALRALRLRGWRPAARLRRRARAGRAADRRPAPPGRRQRHRLRHRRSAPRPGARGEPPPGGPHGRDAGGGPWPPSVRRASRRSPARP